MHIQHYYWTTSGASMAEQACSTGNPDNTDPTDFSGYGSYTVSATTPFPSEPFAFNDYSRSKHSIQFSSGAGWYYFDPYLDSIGDYDNPDYHFFYVNA